MKAIHNCDFLSSADILTVVNKAKIQNESNSQLGVSSNGMPIYCCQQSKDTK